jgi:hypothetical protein
LDADSAARWGKMNCRQMLAHVVDGMKMALGEISCQPKQSFLRRSPFKQIVIRWLPFPKNAPTAPELLSRKPEEIADEIEKIRELIGQFAKRNPNEDWAEHPLFGKLSAKDWGVLAYRHIDHHLEQFGV